MSKLWIIPALLTLASQQNASDLNLTVRSGGSSSITARPGELINYEVLGELSDNLNLGLGLFIFDLEYDGGALAQASAPAVAPLTNFDRPAGITNPAGYGGSIGPNGLVQVGGGQNTINSTFAPFPNGSVTTGVAGQGSPIVLVDGSLTAPTQFGTYTLSVTNVIANAIRSGETGTPFWAVDPAPAGTVVNLTIEVVSLTDDAVSISLLSGGSQNLFLDGGAGNAGEAYWLLSSASGNSPGFLAAPFNLPVPLNPDALFTFMLANPSPPAWINNLNLLDGSGLNTAMFTLPPGLDPGLAGTTVHHAYSLFAPSIHLTSNSVSVLLVP